MRLIASIGDMRAFSQQARAAGRSVGLVPTMGSLHEGHLSLVRQAKRQCDAVVVSIFVNPTQFGPSEDLARYPRNLDRDLEALRPFKIDAVFAPDTSAMYPTMFETYVEPGEAASPFEGASRPGHFRGVATVVLKLLNIVRPDIAYFGQKDFQQAHVIRRVIEDLNLETRLVICPIVREPDGLAKSSRNVYLSAEERQAATVLYRSLRRVEELVHSGQSDAAALLAEMRAVFSAQPRARLEYVTIVDPIELEPVERVTAGSVALVAARVGSTRLIDNMVLGPPGVSPEMLIQLALAARGVAPAQARIPGMETEILRLRIENCRDCAAVSTVRLPPIEFLSKYVKRDYPDLNAVRVAIIGRDAPIHAVNFLYRSPESSNRFVTALFDLVGVKNFDEFRRRFVLTDALRCHCTAPRIPDKALAYCVKHLREELRLFPNLDTVIVMGDDAYWQFQKLVLGRSEEQIKPLSSLLEEKGWEQEKVHIPSLIERAIRVFYCHHPTYGYKRSPSLASLLM